MNPQGHKKPERGPTGFVSYHALLPDVLRIEVQVEPHPSPQPLSQISLHTIQSQTTDTYGSPAKGIHSFIRCASTGLVLRPPQYESFVPKAFKPELPSLGIEFPRWLAISLITSFILLFMPGVALMVRVVVLEYFGPEIKSCLH